MSNIVPFDFEGAAVRVMDQDGDPWFVAKDVATLLGYSDTAKAIRTHCKVVAEMSTPTAGGQQTLKIIPERDVYRLIMRSKLPTAERFEDWVVGTVLPSIRRTGSYGALAPDLNDPAWLRGALLEYSERVLALEAEANENRPKVAAYERIAGGDGSLCVTDAAKTLQMPPRDLFARLSAMKWIYRRAGCAHWVAYQDKLQRGLLEHKVTEVTRSDGSAKITEQVRVTPKGLAKLAEALGLSVAA